MASYSYDFPFGIMDVVELLHLNVRRRLPDSVYVDCPFCGDRRGKMNVNKVKDNWRCNYCGEYGGMLNLYCRIFGVSSSDAYREICDALHIDGYESGSRPSDRGISEGSIRSPSEVREKHEGLPQSERASRQQIHQTYSVLLDMLTLLPVHKAHLLSDKRGLTEEQIAKFQFKSTPPPFLCKSITESLIAKGCTVQGVPGFYQEKSGRWNVNFTKRLSGILLPVVGFDGMIQGMQILLDVPFKDKDDPPEKAGAKYLWFASTTKNMGITSGSPVLFVGNPCARTVYVTEGILKGYIAHTVMNRTFASTAGANNLKNLEDLFKFLAQNGTEQIIEAQDMDKYSNPMTEKGASTIYLMARKYGMECRRLTWNPNYKGIDDWQLALRRRDRQLREEKQMTFKEKYLLGLCNFDRLYDCIEDWHKKKEDGVGLARYLGLTEIEYGTLCSKSEEVFKQVLDAQRRNQRFRIYQLNFGPDQKTVPFAFQGYDGLKKAGFDQPPAAFYKLIWDYEMICPTSWQEEEMLRYIGKHYSDRMPEDYMGRPLAPSDVVELYDNETRRYYYVDTQGFISVRFSPFLAKKAESISDD